jgi:hypothetical protein
MRDTRKSGVVAAGIISSLLLVGFWTGIPKDPFHDTSGLRFVRIVKQERDFGERRPVWIAPTPVYKPPTISGTQQALARQHATMADPTVSPRNERAHSSRTEAQKSARDQRRKVVDAVPKQGRAGSDIYRRKD